jgi:hypothetical protein
MKIIRNVSKNAAIKPLTIIRMATVKFPSINLVWSERKKKYQFTVKAGLLLLCLFSSPIHAQNFYVCSNGGADSNSGLTLFEPWQTFDFAMSRFNTLHAGDAILFCRGGTFTTSAFSRIFNQNCNRDQPCTIADYVFPGTSTVNANNDKLPIITSVGTQGVFNFQDGGNADHDEGYVVKNLSIKGTGTGFGIFLFNDADYVTVDGVTIDGFDIGMYSAGANTSNPGANQVNENITLRNSQIINNKGQGWLGFCNNCLINNNIFTNNGFARRILNHNLYFSGANNFNVTISNNTLHRSTIINGRCDGVSLVAHGVVSDLTITNNTIFEDLGAAAQTCWGISADPGSATEEIFDNVLIASNQVINVGNVGIGCASCTDVQILDNTIAHAQDFVFTGIRIPDKPEDAVKSDRILVSGNHIELFDPNNRGKEGIIVTVPVATIGPNEVIFVQ